MPFGIGKRGSNHVEYQNTEQLHETLRNLPTYDCSTNGHVAVVANGASKDAPSVKVCNYCGCSM
jgi:hypothetical protein